MVKIDEEKCDGCGLCVPSCAEGALQIIDGKARMINDSFCDGLGACLGECPQDAITIEEREAADFDEEAVEIHLTSMKKAEQAAVEQPVACGCPGSAMRTIERKEKPEQDVVEESGPSALATWPVQLMLVPPHAPFLQGADLLISADCVPFALPDFHSRYLKGRVALVGCPKLDDLAHYREKLEAIFSTAKPRRVTVVRMEVPCCTGIVMATAEALKAACPDVTLNVSVIGVRGDVREEHLAGLIA